MSVPVAAGDFHLPGLMCETPPHLTPLSWVQSPCKETQRALSLDPPRHSSGRSLPHDCVTSIATLNKFAGVDFFCWHLQILIESNQDSFSFCFSDSPGPSSGSPDASGRLAPSCREHCSDVTLVSVGLPACRHICPGLRIPHPITCVTPQPGDFRVLCKCPASRCSAESRGRAGGVPSARVLCGLSALGVSEGFVHPTDPAFFSSPSSSATDTTVWAVRFASSLL